MQRRIAVAAATIALALSGCGGGGEETPPVATESEPVATEQPTQPPQTEAPQPKPETRTYKVRSGDTLSEIAERFDTTVRAIVKANDLKDRDSLQVGQQLKIPGKG